MGLSAGAFAVVSSACGLTTRNNVTTTVKINANGSIRLEGDFQLLDSQGNPFDLNGRTVVSICRCGQSQTQPICDGAHGRCGFSSTVEARQLPPPKTKPA